MTAAITVTELVKTYGKVRALDGLDLDVGEGTVMSVLGPNGAGKTTLVRVLTTLIRPDSGSAHVAGIDVIRDPESVRSVVGLSGQYAAVDENLSGRENLVIFGQLYHLGGRRSKQRADELLARFDLSDAADRTVKTYSGGMRRRLDLAGSLVAEPRIMFLDEPTTGLDPRSRIEMWAIIEELVRRGTTLLLTTQYLEEADRLADEIAVVDHGRVIARGTSDDLKDQVGGERIEIVVHDPARVDQARDVLASVGDAPPTVDRHRRMVAVSARGGARLLVETVRQLDDLNIVVDDIGVHRPTLDDVFMSLTGRPAESEQPDPAETVTAGGRRT
jgi:ABC-2 type transport system ATP-binding protein